MNRLFIMPLAVVLLAIGAATPSEAASNKDLTNAIANDADISKSKATKALDSLTKTITALLKKGDKITIKGFGVFSISARAARTGRNPKTGAAINIAAKNIVRFKAGQNLSKAIQ